MAELTLRNSTRADAAALPALLEFHSPSAALTVTPALHAARGTTWVVCSLVTACIAAAALIPIDKVVTTQGKVVAKSATSVVQPLETAIVRSIDVREGQIVHKGDMLARLDPTFATADASALESQVASLETEVERLQAEASGATYHPKDASPLALLQGAIYLQRQAERGFKNENYTQKISSLQSQIQRAVSDKEAYTDRLKVAEELERKRIELERLQVGSQINRLAATDSRLEVKRGLGNATGQVVQAARDLQAMVAERDGYNQQWRGQVSQDLTEQGRKLSDARENLNKANLRRQLVELRAEQDSTVLSIAKVSPGSVLQSGEQFLTLVPIDAPLEVEANIAGMDAGFVHTDNAVTIKFDSFPFTQYGAAEGKVRVVSADSFTSNPDEKQRGVQQNASATGAAFYRSRITLDEIKLHDTPPGFRLSPGMPVTADIKVGERTVVGYLLSRVLPVAMSGMREP
jgi:HlyD family secretion protein